jgi:hypothetical protein
MSDKYTFSFYRNEPQPYIVQRPWWMFWKKPELAYRQSLIRYSHHFNDEDAANLLIQAGNRGWTDGRGRLLKFLMGDAKYVQLEQGPQATAYVATRSQA